MLCEMWIWPNKHLKQNHINGCEYTAHKMGPSFILLTVLVSFPGSFSRSYKITCLKEVIEVMKLKGKTPELMCVCVCGCVFVCERDGWVKPMC